VGEIPRLGGRVRTVSYRRNENDPGYIVTPTAGPANAPGRHIATPLDNTAPASDVDLFLGGKDEVRRSGMVRVVGGMNLPTGHIMELN
jgi:pilus assembly protein CpaC